MTIVKIDYAERVLIVLNPDGSFKGAHQERHVVVKDGDQVLSESMSLPEPLSPEALATVLPDQAALASQIVSMQSALDSLANENTTLAADKSDRDTRIASLTASLVSVNAELAAINNRVDTSGFAVLTPVQLRLALLSNGVTRAQVDSAIAAIPDSAQRETAVTMWEFSSEFHRDHLFVQVVASILGLSSDAVDAMWREASSIR